MGISKGLLIICLSFFFLFIFTSNLAIAKSNVVWFCPDQRSWPGAYSASIDYYDLFAKPALWSNARHYVDVFEFYGYTIMDPKYFDNTTLRDIVSKLNSWNISIALEWQTISPNYGNYCTGDQGVVPAIAALEKIKSVGGNVKYIAMDEPFYYGSRSSSEYTGGCGYTVDKTIDEMIVFINKLKQRTSGVVIGDIEPYPYFSKYSIKMMVARFKEKAGYELPFLHIDVDRSDSTWKIDDVKELNEFCRGRGVKFGIIFTDNIQPNATSDYDFYLRTLDWSRIVNSSMGMPEHIILQSWNDKPDHNLPDSSGYGFTQLVRDFGSIYLIQ